MTTMYGTLTALVDQLDAGAISRANVIRWASPVPAFGNLSDARVATLGLNPSSREFVDESGCELEGSARRFHTLRSLGLRSWSEASATHLRLIIESCDEYFSGNPYDRWFRILAQVVTATNTSYYSTAGGGACHLDVIPYATARKWTDLTRGQRDKLVDVAGDALATLLRDSHIGVLILNGQSVVNHFVAASGARLEKLPMRNWELRRASLRHVTGFAYQGYLDKFAGVDLGRDIIVLGFNHNLQSSYGVTTNVILRIRRWIADAVTSMKVNEST